MKLKEFDILIDIKKNKQIEEIEVVQDDMNSNIFNITLVEGYTEYDLSGLDVEIAFAKSDGTTVLQDLNNRIELMGNKIVCTLKTNTIASPGVALVEVRVLDEDKVLTSARFKFYVRKSIVSDETVESTNEFPILQQLTNSVTEIIATEAERVAAENQREVAFSGYEDRMVEVETKVDEVEEDVGSKVNKSDELQENQIIKGDKLVGVNNMKLIGDFNYVVNVFASTRDEEGYCGHNSLKRIYIKILNSKLDDISSAKFKEWLQSNPQKLNYQLEVEQIIPISIMATPNTLEIARLSA